MPAGVTAIHISSRFIVQTNRQITNYVWNPDNYVEWAHSDSHRGVCGQSGPISERAEGGSSFPHNCGGNQQRLRTEAQQEEMCSRSTHQCHQISWRTTQQHHHGTSSVGRSHYSNANSTDSGRLQNVRPLPTSSASCSNSIPKFVFVARHVWPTKKIVDDLAAAIHNFIWTGSLAIKRTAPGKAKLRKNISQLPVHQGGVGAPNIKQELLAMAAKP